MRVLKKVQDVLGRMHDLQVLIERVRDVQASLSPPNLNVWRELDGLVVVLDESCRRLHARYLRERTAMHGIDRRNYESAAGIVTRRAVHRAG